MDRLQQLGVLNAVMERTRSRAIRHVPVSADDDQSPFWGELCTYSVWPDKLYVVIRNGSDVRSLVVREGDVVKRGDAE
jgi:hypothetical protein